MAAAFSAIRWISLSLAFMFGVVVLGLGGHFTRLLHERGQTWPIEGLSIATSALTVLTLPIMLIVSLFTSNAFTSTVAFELIWLFCLWGLWLATGAVATSEKIDHFPGGCKHFGGVANKICHELEGVQAVAYVTFIILLLYSVTIFIGALVSTGRGHSNAWSSPSSDLPHSNSSVRGEKSIPPAMTTNNPPVTV
ncbi:hypothetical protein ONZ45_g5947 [Pleurotus djamor]|nr:hypothetical protein ONZ45_g5947 [Pleurotus djamor]